MSPFCEEGREGGRDGGMGEVCDGRLEEREGGREGGQYLEVVDALAFPLVVDVRACETKDKKKKEKEKVRIDVTQRSS